MGVVVLVRMYVRLCPIGLKFNMHVRVEHGVGD